MVNGVRGGEAPGDIPMWVKGLLENHLGEDAIRGSPTDFPVIGFGDLRGSRMQNKDSNASGQNQFLNLEFLKVRAVIPNFQSWDRKATADSFDVAPAAWSSV